MLMKIVIPVRYLFEQQCSNLLPNHFIGYSKSVSDGIAPNNIMKVTTIVRQVNEKSCRLRMGAYRDGVKRKGGKIGMGV